MSEAVIDNPVFISEQDLARRWGVTPMTVYNWEKAGIIPQPVRIGVRRKLFRLEDIESYEGQRTMTLPVKRLHSAGLLPYRATDSAAGLDLHAAEEVTLDPGERSLIRTGISMAIPHGCVGLIWPRSGFATQYGIDTMAGVIDADYRGEVHVALINHGNAPLEILVGERIAQMIIQKVEMVTPEDVESLTTTQRGAGGFGSTGEINHEPTRP